MSTKNAEFQYFYGFDYLRVFFCLCIVALHSNILKTRPYDPIILESFTPNISDIIIFNIFFLGVPVFFLASLLLYINNFFSKEHYWLKRIKRLVPAYIFWTTLSIAHKYYKMLGTDKSFYEYFFSSPEKIFSTIISGGHSVFFFIFSLIFLSLILDFLLRVQSVSENIMPLSMLFVTSLLVLYFAPKLLESHGIQFSLYNPLNFLPYVFSALLIKQLTKHNNVHLSFLLLFLAFWIGASIIEWSHLSALSGHWNHIIPPYARISNVFGAMAFTMSAFYISQRPPRIISLLSIYCMGIYCVHSFRVTYAFSNALFANVILGTSAFLFFTSLSDSFVITALMRKQKLLKRFV